MFRHLSDCEQTIDTKKHFQTNLLCLVPKVRHTTANHAIKGLDLIGKKNVNGLIRIKKGAKRMS